MIDVKLKLDLSKSQAYYKEARRYSPGGAPDAKGWDGDLFYIDRAQGNRLWDLDGNEFIDYHAAAGPIILGHSEPELDNAVIDTIKNRGVQFAPAPYARSGVDQETAGNHPLCSADCLLQCWYRHASVCRAHGPDLHGPAQGCEV